MAKRDAPDVIESLRVNGPAQPTESEEVEWGGGELTFATQAQLKERLAVICQQDAERRDFFEGLISSNADLHTTIKDAAEQNAELKEALAEVGARNDALEKEKKDAQTKMYDAQKELRKSTHTVSNDPFAHVIIDGDGYIFQDPLIQDGRIGGEKAAHNLLNYIKLYFQRDRFANHGANHWRIAVRIYLNIDGLSRKLLDTKRIPRLETLRLFMTGLTQAQPLFDVIDVGHGKELTDHKVKAWFDLSISNIQCKHIIVGCSHDHGYVPMLTPHKHNTNVRRITLLHTDTIAREFQSMPFYKESFNLLLKSSNSLNSAIADSPTSPHQPTPPKSPDLPTDPRRRPSQIAPTPASPRVATDPRRRPSHVSPPRSPEVTAAPRPETTATSHRQPLPPQTEIRPSIQSKKHPSIYPLPVLVNKHDERVDAPLEEPSIEALRSFDQRFSNPRLRPCNFHNLHGKCNSPTCDFNHHDLPYEECLALAKKVRFGACRVGEKCRNPSCFSGHVCPQELKGLRPCYRGDRCNLKHFHGIDLVWVKEIPI